VTASWLWVLCQSIGDGLTLLSTALVPLVLLHLVHRRQDWPRGVRVMAWHVVAWIWCGFARRVAVFGVGMEPTQHPAWVGVTSLATGIAGLLLLAYLWRWRRAIASVEIPAAR